MKYWEFVCYSPENLFLTQKAIFIKFYKDYIFKKPSLFTGKTIFPHIYVKKNCSGFFIKSISSNNFSEWLAYTIL